jgi:hypothetical protein
VSFAGKLFFVALRNRSNDQSSDALSPKMNKTKKIAEPLKFKNQFFIQQLCFVLLIDEIQSMFCIRVRVRNLAGA